MIVNALTVDVEDYFHVHAFSDVIQRKDWDSFESRVEKNTLRILDILEYYNVTRLTDNGHDDKPRGTFFILGWLAKRFPDLVKEIHRRGHEVACHGYNHQLIFHQTKEAFKHDVRKAKFLLEDLIGGPILGYRAPTYSITKKTLWALEVLHELGFKYDSSIFPVRHDTYGYPEAPRFPFLVIFEKEKGHEFIALDGDSDHSYSSLVTGNTSYHNSIIEFPLATFRTPWNNIPVAGGGYFRLIPYRLTMTLLRRINKIEKKPFVFYLHPWEMDPELPKVPGAGLLSRFRTYWNLDKTEKRLIDLLSKFYFLPISSFLND